NCGFVSEPQRPTPIAKCITDPSSDQSVSLGKVLDLTSRGVQPVKASASPEIDPAPSIFSDAIDLITREPFGDGVSYELRMCSLRIINTSHATLPTGDPEPANVITIDRVHPTFGHSVADGEDTEAAFFVARNAVETEAYPKIAGLVLGKNGW